MHTRRRRRRITKLNVDWIHSDKIKK